MSGNQKLGPGDIFPELRLQLVGGAELVLPYDLDMPFNIVLFYRGHW